MRWVLLLLLLAGCAAPGAVEPVPRSFDEASLAAPPEWRIGEWWTYEVTHEASGMVTTMTSVVANQTANHWAVGHPIEQDATAPLIWHLPPLGDVRKDLSFDMHDLRFEALQWPLRDGMHWSATWMHGEAVELFVETVDTHRARIAMTGDVEGEFVYDAHVGNWARMHVPGYVLVDLDGHGYGWSGDVVVPAEQDLVFYHGRTAGGLRYPEQTPAPPSDVIGVEGYDEVAFALITRDRGQAGITPPGQYDITATAPDGTMFQQSFTAGAENYAIQLHQLANPNGAWTMEATAAGTGYALLEGIGYQRHVVRL